MSSVFKITSHRKVYIANQNFFHIHIVHPSYTENCHIISYVIKGGWKLKIGDEIINAKKDCVFIQPANVPRTGLELCPADTNTVFVHFSAEEGDAYGANLEAAGDGFLTMPNFIDASENGEIKTLLMKIFEEKLKENEVKATAYLNLLLAELAENNRYDRSPYTCAINIKKLINDNISANISNAEIAKNLGISVRTAETAFKQSFGITIHRYQLIRKIEQAKFWLEYFSDMKILDVSYNLGFFDEYHFSKQFKNIVGMSPTEYRRMVMHTKVNG